MNCGKIKYSIKNGRKGYKIDINEPQSYSAEYAALNHEVYDLTRRLEEKDKEYKNSTKIDLHDPFRNPTEFKWYRDDYSEILPWATMPEFSISFEPAKVEKSAIRRFYNIGGFTALFHFFASSVFALTLMLVVKWVLIKLNPDAASGAVTHYMRKSSILAAVNLVTYLFANVGFALIGLKWAKIKPSFMIKTKDYHFSDAVQHCFAGVFIWYTAAIISSGIENVFSKYGFSTDVMDMDYGETGIGFAVMLIYSCIIAPITEEIFYRGALMKIFSKSNQRFGIFMSALFFGLAHGNLPQFTLAFLIGIFLGHIDMKHNSIIPSIVVHILINTLVTVISEFKGNTIVMGLFGLSMILCWLIGIVMLVIFRSECKLPVSTPAQSRRGIAVAKTSVGIIAAVTVQALYTILIIYQTKVK
ncbi:MAG: CPBP family intramembrane metalloprotease [Ruminococcus sp.]|uniref:CPBP family intramembrane glutamic endopeptidase n=1 Tax=Ruminococcus sp. TaxID=41978 RepID=UPI001B0D872B|nr:type II CAAX endopeptidase family protein [Ruminococcus sp.]MBO7474565.1 CPBP family intramembrane metalloprotease [Ruminococcus sp.]